MNSLFTVAIRRRALKQLADLPKIMQRRIEAKIDMLSDEAYPSGCKKLAGEADLWRLRIGDYRVIYLVNTHSKTIEIRAIAHRQSIYE